MLTTTIRTTVIGLIAASGLAFASAPLTQVASADKNNYGYQKTVGKRPWHNTCANATLSLENATTLTEVLAAEGDTKGAEKALNLAITIHENAVASGCHMDRVKSLHVAALPLAAARAVVVSPSNP